MMPARKEYTDTDVKLVFELHGNQLDVVIASCYLELFERCAALEARVKDLEARRK